MHYVHTDHLGSLNVIANQSGAIEQELSYDAWGNRRNPATWVNLTSSPANLITHRGFTGHEHMDEFGLINMNGRMYDPVLGRFLSPDPIIANPNNTQDYNRYSYVVNNPLMFTDPSGYISVSMESFFKDFETNAPIFDETGFTLNGFNMRGGGHRNTFRPFYDASGFIDPNGTILDVINDGDPRIYEVTDLEKWKASGKSKKGLKVVGYIQNYQFLKDYIGRNILDEDISRLISEHGGGFLLLNHQPYYFPDTRIIPYSSDVYRGDVYVNDKDVIKIFSQSVTPIGLTVGAWGVAIYNALRQVDEKSGIGAIYSTPLLFLQITLKMEDWRRGEILNLYNKEPNGGQGMIMRYNESIQDWNGYLHYECSTTLIDAATGKVYGTFSQNYLPNR